MGLLSKSGKSVIGLNVGTDSMKAVEVRRHGGKVELLGLGVYPTPDNCLSNGVIVDHETLSAAIKELLGSQHMKTKAVISSVAGQPSLVIRIIEVPRMSESELKDTMKYEVERHIPFNAAEVIMDFKPLAPPESNPEAQNMEVLLVVAQEDMVNEHVRTLETAGLRPTAIDIEPLAAARAVVNLADGHGETSETVVVIDIGKNTTDISIVRDGVLGFTRTVPVAGEMLTRAIADGLGLDLSEAERAKKEIATAVVAAAAGAPPAGGPAPATEEEEELGDFLLTPGAAPQPAAEPDAGLDLGFDFGAEPEAAAATPVAEGAAEDVFSFDFAAPATPAASEPAAAESAAAADAFSFDLTSADEPAAAPATPSADTFSFGLAPETPQQPAEPEAFTPDAAPGDVAFDFGLQAAEPDAAAPTEPPAPAFDFQVQDNQVETLDATTDFSTVSEPPAPAADEKTDAAAAAFDFELDLDSGEDKDAKEDGPPPPRPAFDADGDDEFSFDFDLDDAGAETPAGGELSFDATELAGGEKPAAAATELDDGFLTGGADDDGFLTGGGSGKSEGGTGLVELGSAEAATPEALYEAMSPVLQDLVTEVRRSLEYYSTRYPNVAVNRVLLCGGGSRLRDLDKFLTRELGIETRVANPIESMVVSGGCDVSDEYLAEVGPSLTVAIGLAVRDMVV